MAVSKPYRRNVRQFTNGSYSESGKWMYILHPKFAQDPDKYVRGFLLLLKDVQELFDYVEPSDQNLRTHSFRIHELLLRSCVEVEANCKAILSENGYSKSSDWNMADYRKINTTHRLSSYKVKVPYWTGAQNIRSPFFAWDSIDITRAGDPNVRRLLAVHSLPWRGMNRRLIVQFDPDEPSMSAPTFAEPDQGPLAGGRKVNARHDLTLGLWRRDCEISRGFPRW